MARRNASYQQLFLESLDGAGQGAMQAGKLVGDTDRANAENIRQEAESKARLGLVGEQTRGAKTDADSKSLSYDQAFREEGIKSSMLGGLDAHKADPLYADAKLASLTLGRTVTPEELRTQRGQEQKKAGLEVEGKEFELGEKKNKAGRDAAESTAGIAETQARTKLYGAQAEKEAKGGHNSKNWQITDTDKGKVQVDPESGETRPLVDREGKPLRSPKEPGIKLNEAQSKTIAAAGMAKQMLDEISNKFKSGGLGGAAGLVSDVVESVPFVGGKMAPKTAEYNDQRRIVAETFLREATGAAAPKEEVKFYSNLLPEPGDNETQAQSAISSFRQAVKAKVKGVAETLRAQRREDDAKSIEENLEKLFSDSADIKPADDYESMTDDQLREALAKRRGAAK